jgi:hypothetical protein
MSKRKYVKRAVKEEPVEVTLTEFNRSLLHLIKTPPVKTENVPKQGKGK